ncbi:MAG: phosphatase PAP2 family protein [Acidimicrobiia bacterium]|nr:phosphatase PAP2 family protein [Acidimicrobiia bacterium]
MTGLARPHARRRYRGRYRRRALDALAVLLGLAVLGIGMATVGDAGTLPGWERSLFEAVNGLPDALMVLAWPLQQLGVLAVGPVLAVVALLAGRRRLALAVLCATVAKLVLERMVKDMVSRGRPALSIGPDLELRGHVPTVGESFVSGHAVLATALAGLVSPYLGGRAKLVPWCLAAGVAVGRVYVGAHNPLDVICGAGLGLAIAGALNLVFGVPAPRVLRWGRR